MSERYLSIPRFAPLERAKEDPAFLLVFPRLVTFANGRAYPQPRLVRRRGVHAGNGALAVLASRLTA